MKLVEYIKHPEEQVVGESSKYLVGVFVLYLIISYVLRGATGVVGALMAEEGLSEVSPIEHYPLWFVVLVPAILEESGFRLALRRTLPYLLVATFVVTFIGSAAVFEVLVYSWEHLFGRILFSLAFVGIAFAFRRQIFGLKYNYYFYILCGLFAVVHLANLHFSEMNPAEIAVGLINTLLIVPSALILGYVRVSYGFLYAVSFHLLHNAVPMVLYFVL